MILGWLFQQWKWLKTLESKKSKAELSLLKSQINPHFFFNTLNNLYGLTVEKSDDAPNVVLKLSDMMRYTIYMGKEDLVPLKDEVDYLQNYIELHKIRYQKIRYAKYWDKHNNKTIEVPEDGRSMCTSVDGKIFLSKKFYEVRGSIMPSLHEYPSKEILDYVLFSYDRLQDHDASNQSF